ncbi:MAG: heavy metal translocating P-type ATPase [Acidobacteriota bacterium]|nr:heavy metal translocating P-type ATPase [Acidobacteriota bacterium]
MSFHVIDGRMTVDLEPDRFSVDDVKSAVAKLGMRADDWESTLAPAESWWQRHGRRAVVTIGGLALAAGLSVQGVTSGGLAETFLAHGHGEHGVEPAALALFIVAIVAGLTHSVRRALMSLVRLRPDMNALVLVSVIGAMVLQEWAEAGTLAFLYGLSGLIENWSAMRARSAIGSLVRLSPAMASVVHGDHEHRIPVERVTVGSHVRVRPGERVPCDGDVFGGSSYVDQALVTGESVPVWKAEGDPVFAGTLNAHGVIDVRATRSASDTTLARIIRMVGESHRHRAPTERLVDQFARYYTPLMFVVALLVGGVPFLVFGRDVEASFYQAMLILLISCPCALAISTPVTIAAALTSAAWRGVVIKGGAHLEELGRLRTVAFDKTGVVTRGEPVIRELRPVGGRSEMEVLGRLLALEMRSEHPLSRAIVDYARACQVEPIPVTDFQALEGRGAQVSVDGQVFWAGSARLAFEKTGDDQFRQVLADMQSAEHTVVVCGVRDEVWALVALSDPVRAEAASTVARLREQGIRSVLLTGDNAVTAEGVGQQVGVSDVRAELLPEGKAHAVQELVKTVGSTAMVGDGINDSQALLAASVGVALGGATDIAVESAEVVLMGDDLQKLPFLVEHARRAKSVIIQNISLALGAKAGFLLVMAAGAATLWMAVAADMGATLLVTFNGLRMLRSSQVRPSASGDLALGEA